MMLARFRLPLFLVHETILQFTFIVDLVKSERAKMTSSQLIYKAYILKWHLLKMIYWSLERASVSEALN